jgi:glycosyltransferase involved in cell wall biosynthesis
MAAATAACTAPPGDGGLGRHFAELLRALARDGNAVRFYGPRASDAGGTSVSSRLASILNRLPPARFNPSTRALLDNVLFDRAVASIIEPGKTHVGFAGHSLDTFRRVAAVGSELVLASPTAHVAHTRRQYTLAFTQYPLEQPWLGDRLAARTLREYELADRIQVASDYVRESFLNAGVPADRLERVVLTAPDRFRPAPEQRPDDGVFRIVYVGGLTIAKGIPVLLDAFDQLPLRNAELTLVGRWASRGMRRRVEAALAADHRIRLIVGDPLRELQRADAYVHPSYQDGLGYSPLEALACGVPVVVTEDTGMKEHVRVGETGWVVPTGDVDALVETLMVLSP